MQRSAPRGVAAGSREDVMLFVWGFMAGFVFNFLVCRYADRVMREAGDACGHNCDACTARCVGYHCYLSRRKYQEMEDYNGY